MLRRFAQSLKDQNWTTIAIEFVLLVVGVFLGIQVANWNQARADERRGHAYALRLAADLERDLVGRRELVAYFAAVLDSVRRADALLASPDADPKALVIAAYRASEVNYRPPSRATWDEIVSSGDIGLLPPGVSDHAGAYFAFDTAFNALDALVRSNYRHRVRSILPLPLQQALRDGCSDVRDATQQITAFVPDCELAVAPDVIAATAAALRADPRLQAELRFQYSDVYSAHRNLTGDAAAIERALAALGHAPGGQGGTGND